MPETITQEAKGPKKPRRRLSKKAKGFARDIAKGMNGTQAALKNYDTKDPNTASSIATENLQKPAIIEEIVVIEKTIAEQIPDSLLVEKHIALLNKKEVKRTFNHETGEWIEIETGQVETQAVKAGLELAYKIKKLGTDSPPPSTTPASTYNFIFSSPVQAGVAEINERIKQFLMKPKEDVGKT